LISHLNPLNFSLFDTCGQTDKHDEANKRIFISFYRGRASKVQFAFMLRVDVMTVNNPKSVVTSVVYTMNQQKQTMKPDANQFLTVATRTWNASQTV
jgi:hypothetical protein